MQKTKINGIAFYLNVKIGILNNKNPIKQFKLGYKYSSQTLSS